MPRILFALVLSAALAGLGACGQKDQSTGDDQQAENGMDNFVPNGNAEDTSSASAEEDAAATSTDDAMAAEDQPVTAETLPGTGDDGATPDATAAMSHDASDPGEDQFQRGFYEEAMDTWKQEAEEGNDYAAYRLGVEYFDGQRVPRDLEQAAHYQQLAAELGNPAAMFELASYYEDGIGMDQNIQEAASWYLQSAERGYPPAQHNVATMLEDGEGIEQNLVEAYVYYSLAIEAGFRVNFVQDEESGEAQFVDPREHLRDLMTPEQIDQAEAELADWTPIQ
jgi:TPR repeat protein